MAVRMVNPFIQYFDDNGNPLSGGKLQFYEPASTTPKDTYSDNDLTTPNTNPVILDASGRIPNIFLDGAYRVILSDSNDVEISDRDNVNASTGNQLENWDSTISYSINDLVYASDGNYYISLVNNNLGNEPSISPAEWQEITFPAANNPSFNGSLTLVGADGLIVNPGSDIDADLITVGVSGFPQIYWDESEGSFRFTDPLYLDTALEIVHGGTGAENAQDARANLGATSFTMITPISISMGGNGVWTTISNGTLAAAGATHALIKCFTQVSPNANVFGSQSIHLRETGSGLGAVTSNRAVHAVAEADGTADGTGSDTNDMWVELNGSQQFDIYQVQIGTGTAIEQAWIVGYFS